MKAKIAGIIIVLINLFWLLHHLRYLYLYQNPDIFWFAMYPTWYLLLNTLLGFIGIVIGIIVYQRRIKISIGILITLALIGLELSTDLILNL